MSETITYVGIDAHKVDLQVAMLRRMQPSRLPGRWRTRLER
ncbi:MAG: hypothetical protein OXF93_14430 [Acidobacteria bacterium]|nr:hypothetical protein [Acidobacteriota bacterium]